MTSNNAYYKSIYEKICETTASGTHTDNWYLKRIAEQVCSITYSETKCDEKYLKDTVSEVTGVAYEGYHFKNYFLHRWAEYLTGEDYPNKYDNYFLGVIDSSLGDRPTLTLTITPPSTSSYGTTLTLTATLLDGNDDPIESETISFYDGDTLIDTDTTDSDGEAEITVSDLSIGTHTIKAVWGNVTTTQSYTITKIPTTLTITPPTLVYTDEFYVTGGLTGDSVGIDNAEVTLHWKVGSGSEQTATVYTDDGTYTFSRTAPTSIVEYTFWVTYDGDSIYGDSETSKCYVTPNKETTVLNVTSPDAGSMYYNDSILVSGSLLTNDNEPVVGNTITVIDNTDATPLTLATFTTDSDGEFEGRVTNYNKTHYRNWYIESTTTNEYTQSSSTKSNIYFVNPNVLIDKTDGKQILSYADKTTTANTEYCTVTGTYTGGAVSGKSMEFYGYVDGTNDVLLDTVSTDGNGQASYTYVSAGVGDIGIYAKCGTFVSESYTIQDIDYYAEWSKIISTWSTDTSVSGRTIYNYLTNFGNDVSIEFKYKNSIPSNTLIGFGKFYSGGNEIKGMFFNYNNSPQAWWSQGTSVGTSESLGATPTTNDVFKITVENNTTVKWYLNGTLLKTKTARTDFGQTLRIDDFTSTPMQLDYIKVKKL